MHWFLVGRNSHAPFNKLTVEAEADAISEQHIKQLLNDNHHNYIGGPDELRTYIDNYINNSPQNSQEKVKPSKLKLPKRRKIHENDPVARRLPMSQEPLSQQTNKVDNHIPSQQQNQTNSEQGKSVSCVGSVC